MSQIADHAQREQAIDPCGSFCVSAPAGSGKTELLIQRYLGLLPRVSRPEQILAITFTRKAAAEMRERVLGALRDARDNTPCDSPHEHKTRELALNALKADERGNWQLLRSATRLNIKTIDSFCLSLTRQMPVASGLGGQVNPQDDSEELYVAAVKELFGMLDEGRPVAADLRALLAHFDNNWEGLQRLLVSMLHRRDQWRMYVGVHHQPEESERYLRQVVHSLVAGELAPLAQLLAPYSGQLLELQQYSAQQLGEEAPAAFPRPEPADLPLWRKLRAMLMTKGGTWLKNGPNVKQGFPPDKKGEGKERKDQVKALLQEFATIPELQQRLADVALLPEMEEGSTSWQLVLHLSRLLPILAAELLLVFRAEGAVDHSQVAQLALQALGEDDAPTELALRLDYCIDHLLVDEFQDTSINQYELLHKLTRGWGEYNAENPEAPRTLMIVGDAMQSIYGFRDANVGLFLDARDKGFNGVSLQPLELACNFRSQAGLVHWVNETFAEAFPEEDDVAASQVKYREAVAVRDAAGAVSVSLDAFRGDDAIGAEVEFICAQIADLVAAGETDIAVLGRQRNHLRPISARLKEQGVAYFAQDLESLSHSSAVADLLTLCRALASDVDRVAWYALLRAPWCGLTLADLLSVSSFGGAAVDKPVRLLLEDTELLSLLSDDGRGRLEHLRSAVREARASRDRLGLRVWVERAWLQLGGPETAINALALEDVEHFFTLLEQAEGEGRGLDLDWLDKQVQSQYMSGGNPDCPVQLLTLHKAKGLEFEHVFIPRLNGQTPGDKGELLLWDEHNGPSGRVFLLAANDRSPQEAPTLYNYLRAQNKNKTRLEATRLLYVGATRAIKHLHLSAGISWDEKKDSPKDAPPNSLLATIWPAFAAAMKVHEAQAPEEETTVAAPPLVRLEKQCMPRPHSPAPAEAEEENKPERADNHLERSVGTVVHLALEELSLQRELPEQVTQQQWQRWYVALKREGLAGERLDAGMAAVKASLEQTLSTAQGRWVLDTGHTEPRSEWALTVEHGDAGKDIVVDRTFIDAESGVRWIVDYKTSQPAPDEDTETFLAREAGHYRDQLITYREALRHIGDDEIRCALYFTALGVLHTLDELQLPARGE